MAKKTELRRFMNFDKAFAEKRREEAAQAGEEVSFVVGGVRYVLPPNLPAKAAVISIRMDAEGEDGEDADEQEVEKLMLALFGEEKFEQLLSAIIPDDAPAGESEEDAAERLAQNRALSMDELGDIVKWAFRQYRDKAMKKAILEAEKEAAESGNAEAPETGASETSSSIGD
jgi:hypothetical protein